MKMERTPSGSEIARFWFEHGNTDLYSDKKPFVQTFVSSEEVDE